VTYLTRGRYFRPQVANDGLNLLQRQNPIPGLDSLVEEHTIEIATAGKFEIRHMFAWHSLPLRNLPRQRMRWPDNHGNGAEDWIDMDFL
jgi:hypothetical protein